MFYNKTQDYLKTFYKIIFIQANSTVEQGPYYKKYFAGSRQLVTTVLGLSFTVTDGHYKIGEIYLKCAARLSTYYLLYSDEKIIRFTKRPPTESIISNQVKQAKMQGKYEL